MSRLFLLLFVAMAIAWLFIYMKRGASKSAMFQAAKQFLVVFTVGTVILVAISTGFYFLGIFQ